MNYNDSKKTLQNVPQTIDKPPLNGLLFALKCKTKKTKNIA